MSSVICKICEINLQLKRKRITIDNFEILIVILYCAKCESVIDIDY